MARKASQQKNSLNCNVPNKKHTIPESVYGCLSNQKEKSAHGGKVDIEEVLNSDTSDSQYGSGDHSHERLNNTKNIGSGKRNKQRPDNVSYKETLEDTIMNLAQPLDIASKGRDLAGNDLLSDASRSRTDDGTLRGSNHDISDTGSSISEGSYLQNLMDSSLSSIVLAGKRLEALALFILEVANGWLQRQKPHLTALAAVILDVRDYICAQAKHMSPIIGTWLLHSGKLMLLLSMLWLYCAIRGLDSLLRLGTTSFFTVIWCSIFSIIAMIGITKILLVTVVATLLMIFNGFILAILLIIIFSTAMLWLYGSFWTTGFVILFGVVTFASSHERVAMFVTTLYAMHCARIYTGWIGLLLGLNLSFISGDVLIHFLKILEERGSNRPHERVGGESHFYGEPLHSSPVDDASQPAFARANDRGPGDPSTSGTETELTSENEVARLLNCNDYYSALGLTRYENIDVTSLKKEYRKKAMLVHPDKNMGNEKAAEAFKKLQNAYEVLLDSLKRKTYDDQLRREELMNYFRRFHNASQDNGKNNFHGDSRRIACNRCNNFHIWTPTKRMKSQARWCQDCDEFHQAKDGDGWVEQAFHPLLFGLLQKMEAPHAYVCAESRIYDVTEWFICQGMRCPANTHKPSFHVNTSVTSKHNDARGSSSADRGSGGMPSTRMDETMTEEEFFEWLQNAVQSGMFEASNVSSESPSARAGNNAKSNAKKKRKGKKQM